MCGQGEEWTGRPMSLILDHISGVSDDNRLTRSGNGCARTRTKNARSMLRTASLREMRRLLLGLTITTAALAPGVAQAAEGDPMPLSSVTPGMKCTAYSVFKGTAVETFDVEIVDIVGQASNGDAQPRLLVRVSGPRVDATGVGPGFSGSPILCPAADGTNQNAGAISETIGDYGGKLVLATPIEQILATPVDPPAVPERRAGLVARARDAAIFAGAKPLIGPMTVSGVRPSIMRGLTAAAAKRDVALIAAPRVPSDSIPPQTLVPGSAVGVGLSSGDVIVGAVGTVAFTRGNDVWAFGHSFDGAGARSLLLQDAYVASLVNNPIQVPDLGSTYKFAGSVNTLGTLTNDGFNAVAGRVGVFPPTTYTRVVATDLDTEKTADATVRVTDETDVRNPTGYGNLSFIAPLALAETATDVLGAAPQQVAATMCLKLRLKERAKQMRFCNRYVADGTTPGDYGTNPVAQSAGIDAATALALFDTYKGKPVHPTHVTARIRQTRAQRQAYLRTVELPKTVRRGETVNGTFTTQIVRGEAKSFPFEWTVPDKLKPGKRTVKFRGTDPDYGGGFFDTITIDFGSEEEYDSEGPRSLKQIAKLFHATHRYDGIRAKGERVFRDPTYRIAGVAIAQLRVKK
jgi:hypothetical protein